MKKEMNKKQKWQKPEMIRIALNAKQAVLSCCDIGARGMTWGAYQCEIGGCGVSSNEYSMSS